MRCRILYVARSLEIGGLERVISLLANNLDKDRYETYVCCTAVAGNLADTLHRKDRLFVLGNTGRINVKGISCITRIIKEHAIDLVHSHELTGLLYAYPAARIAKVPIVHTKHGYSGIHQEKKPVALIGKLFSRSVSEYICVSEELRKRMEQEIGISAHKMTTIYNGIDSPPRREKVRGTQSRDIVIGSVGRLTKVKNYEILIHAFEELRGRYPRIRLEIVGGGENEQNLRELVDRLSLSDSVILHGYQLDVWKYYDRFDIFALTSIYEGLSMSLLEAISRSKLCIVSDVGGNTEIVENGVNGFVFESNNRSDLVSRLSEAIENIDSEHIENLRNNAYETFQNKFSVQTMVQKHEELYSRHIRNRAPK